ncbi:ketohexokinase isoform X2 [Lingula anatina]|uniref:Ketohexokinase isoform X2 n=1 Tax=Lingula anatina TaxID=7574 RepID=A0A1S3IX57_LINAN|nr:ketohexokinase isoform X2 [Lingula anatina]|eukprot:XP_013402129.1 ketohexokinase isoform X2 [Lingula anatina]
MSSSLTSPSQQPPSVLCVGLTCLDLLCYLPHFPKEDTGNRCIDMYWQRGGNASNTSTVLALLGARTECLCTIANTREKEFLKEDFAKYAVNIENCVYLDDCTAPVSNCIINVQNGSRTILHSNKSLPEFSYKDFQKIDLKKQKYQWVHFEGRPNVPDISSMLQAIDSHNKAHPDEKIITSVELEKTRMEIVPLLDKADYVFVSKEHAQIHGYQCKEDTVEGLGTKIRDSSVIICAWGESGACAKPKHGPIVASPIFPPEGGVVDTLGAGDSFNAGVIFALSRGKMLQEAVSFGCLVAGKKCGFRGFEGLKGFPL